MTVNTEHKTNQSTETTPDEASTDDTSARAATSTDETSSPRPSTREAKYRRQLRETEAERDQLRERVETMQRAEAERLATNQLAKPAALWATGITLGDLLDDDGTVDPDKVGLAAQHASDQLGVAPPNRPPRPDLTQGGKGGAAMAADPWTDAFKAER